MIASRLVGVVRPVAGRNISTTALRRGGDHGHHDIGGVPGAVSRPRPTAIYLIYLFQY